ncbi:ABC transporter permease [Heyndrickxia sporothermodurans]
MNQFFIFFNKENKEMVRNFKWIWMPLLFILLGLIQPVTTYNMPKIIDSIGNLPEGAIVEIPTPTASEVLFGTVSQQFNMIGILVIVLAFMASVSGERKNGSAALVLVKPVSFQSYLLAKWLSALLLVWVSYFLGMLANWYYTYQLFEMVNFDLMVKGLMIYGLWITFITTLIFFFGSMMKSSGLTAAFTLTVTIVLSFLSNIIQKEWLPAKLFHYTGELWSTSAWPQGTTTAITVTLASICILIVSALIIFRSKELL